ncbi:hypothetical protein [Deinococcus maricopensis]|uniref:Uncharacterized protein n=1 Tax=Deinococcus maricopensis (strain DSM 21211 / LMG 22137 / NRRL B-23946 / LB-34) TaxID=709986 RepID=E8U986_DEIML|nr:hypothetical protein [Deinococcus maricopensis]ADV67625.1 hypothetical protein Deima_1980 [Deinococcus maricopensis DSM 21211]
MVSRFVRWGAALALVLSSAVHAETQEKRIPGTKAFYWAFRDPYTGQNMGTVILDAEQTNRASLFMKCLGDGNLNFFVSTPVRLLADDDRPYDLRKQIGNLYRVTVQFGAETVTPTLGIVGYLPVQTQALAFDEDTSARIYSAFVEGRLVKVRIEGRGGALQRDLNVSYTFSPEGFVDASEAVDACDAG